MTRTKLALIAALLLVSGGLAFYHFYGQIHTHGAGAALQLNAGQKWESDQPLRTGMERIRELVNAAKSSGTPSDMQALSTSIQHQIEYLTTNCKLPLAADETLHVIIADFLEGADLVTKNEPERGLSIMRMALDTYPKYFNHAGWGGLLGTKEFVK